jgi:MFS family permease
VTDATEATDRGIVLQLRRGAPARDRREDLPVAEMVVVGVAVFTITALAFFRVAILPSIGADLAMSTAQLGLFSATYAVGRVLTDLPAGQLADRIPVVSVMRRAAWIVALGSGLLAIAPVSAVAFAGMFVLGVGTALANTSGATYFSTVAPESRRGLAVSGFQLGGQAFGPAISGALATLGTWRTSGMAAVFIAVASSSGRTGVGSPPCSLPTPTAAVEVATAPGRGRSRGRCGSCSTPFHS